MGGLYGDWSRAGVLFRTISQHLEPMMEKKLLEQAEVVLKTIKGHIDRQDLPWSPLARKTVVLKGHSRVYWETGELYKKLAIRRIRAPKGQKVVFVGASPWVRHSASGKKLSDLMILLEYGHNNVPPRPIIRPSWAEVSDKVKGAFVSGVRTLVQR